MNAENRPQRGLTMGYFPILVAAACSIGATFALAGSSLEAGTKTQILSAIVLVFLLTCAGLHIWRTSRPIHGSLEQPISDSVYDVLSMLDHAGEILAGSITTSDVCRLVASRVRLAVRARSICLFLLDDAGGDLRAVETDGVGCESDYFGARRCCDKRSVHVGDRGVVSIPLLNEMEPFGVLQLHFDPTDAPDESCPAIFDAIGTRVAPLILNSRAFERTVSNALIDVTTELPNERALYLILENQIAESQRKRDDRPLTLLSIDIRGFDEINTKFGHAAGDRALAFVAEVVRGSLRQMDFLARCNDDEFLAVLPTASQEIAQDVIARVTTSLFGRRLNISSSGPFEMELCFGWAAFGDDGETAQQLIAAARLRKERSKSAASGKVLLFSKETVN